MVEPGGRKGQLPLDSGKVLIAPHLKRVRSQLVVGCRLAVSGRSLGYGLSNEVTILGPARYGSRAGRGRRRASTKESAIITLRGTTNTLHSYCLSI